MSTMLETTTGDYPEAWDEYVGQTDAVRALKVMTIAADKRGTNLPHILITSPYAGIGKTALALLAARELGRPVHVVSGAMTIAQVRMMFTRVSEGDVIFYDEFHKVMDSGKRNAEWLLHYLQDGVLVTPLGEEQVPAVTIIGATTDKGALPNTIVGRFIVLDLAPYTYEEAQDISLRLSDKILEAEGLPGISYEVAEAVATAGSHQPRMMRQILNALRDLTVIGEITVGLDGQYDMTEALTFAGVTADGLTRDAQNYLRVMFTEMRAEPAGQNLLRDRLGLTGRSLLLVEQLLQDKDLMRKTKSGRMLTATGIKRAMALEEDN